MPIGKRRNKESKPDFDEVMSEVQQEVETNDAEQTIIDRVPELRELNTKIDEATNGVINAKLTLESAIQQSQREEIKLTGAVTTISNKVDTINNHIDDVIKTAPSKMHVKVSASDADWKKIEDAFAKHRQWIIAENLKHIRQVNDMLADERRRVQERYKEYDGCYLGHYIQWFFWFFFTLGFGAFMAVVVNWLGSYYGWFK